MSQPDQKTRVHWPFLSFLGMAFSILGLGVFFVGWSFAPDFNSSVPMAIIYWGALFCAFCSMVFSFSVRGLNWGAYPITLMHLTSSFLLGFFTLALPLLLLKKVFGGLYWLLPISKIHAGQTIQWGSWLVLALCLLMMLWGMLGAYRTPSFKKVTVKLKKIKPDFSGLNIAQISDLHIAATLPKEFVERVVQKVMQANADIIVITGDLVDGPAEILKGKAEPLRKLKAPLGVYFVTGNHEYYSGAAPWLVLLKDLGLHILMNEHVILEKENQKIALGGVSDLKAGQFDRENPCSPEKAFAGIPEDLPRILLAHQPNTLALAQKAKVDLQISGHTHGGQYWPWNYFAKRSNVLLSGLKKFGDCWLYVSQGTGFWGPPLRIGAKSEVTQIKLLGVPSSGERGASGEDTHPHDQREDSENPFLTQA